MNWTDVDRIRAAAFEAAFRHTERPRKINKNLINFNSFRAKIRTRDILSAEVLYHTLDPAGYFLL